LHLVGTSYIVIGDVRYLIMLLVSEPDINKENT
jgi:hypothetical protein